MTETARSSNLGGYREGSGRKAYLEKPVRIVMQWEEGERDQLDAKVDELNELTREANQFKPWDARDIMTNRTFIIREAIERMSAVLEERIEEKLLELVKLKRSREKAGG